MQTYKQTDRQVDGPTSKTVIAKAMTDMLKKTQVTELNCNTLSESQTNGYSSEQTGGQEGRQTDRQTDRHATERLAKSSMLPGITDLVQIPQY